jgi:hypothetical protein
MSALYQTKHDKLDLYNTIQLSFTWHYCSIWNLLKANTLLKQNPFLFYFINLRCCLCSTTLRIWPLSSNSRYKSKNDADEAVSVVSLTSSSGL